MKKTNLLIRQIMKISFLAAMCFFIFSQVLLASVTKGQGIKDNITVSFGNESLDKALLKFSEVTHMQLTYDGTALGVNNYTVNAYKFSNTRPLVVLSYLLTNTGIVFRETPEGILLVKKSTLKVAGKVIGTVVDENGKALPGATVIIVETGQGTQSNPDGTFSLSVQPGTYTLKTSFLSYQTNLQKNISVPEGQTVTLNIKLIPDNSSLNEVLVIGYGAQKKSDLTGSVGNVKGNQLMQRPAINVEQSLAGQIAGVNVSTNSGRPGGRTSISIRGFSSINASNVPLYVVDGIISTDGITNLNPNDVESIDVLKDASATAIYGTRGSNGVIIITTKRGKKGEPMLSYDTYYSLNQLPPDRKAQVLNSKQWLGLEEQVYKNAAYYDPAGFAAGKYVDPIVKRKNYLVGNTLGNKELFTLDQNRIPQPIYNVDWNNMVFRTSLSQSHNLSYTGGDQKTNYGFSLGYANDNGIVRESYQKRYNVRAVIDQQTKSWLKVGGTLSYSKSIQAGVDDSNGSYNVLRNVIEMVPFIPNKYADGSYGYAGDYAGLEKLDNPLSQIYENTILYNKNSFNGNSYAKVKFMEGLEFTSTFGVNVINNTNTLASTSNLQGGASINSASITNSESRFWQWSNTLNYVKKINSSNMVNILLGTENQKYNYLADVAGASNFPDNYYSYNNLGAGAVTIAPSSSTNSYQLASYFGRVNYNYKEKYLLTATGRFDGSSRFGSNNKFAFFPSTALAWRVSQEDFLKDNKTISNLKLRASYGITGNSEIGSYKSMANLTTNTYPVGGSRASGSAIGTLANPDLKWERTQQYDLGFELGLFNNRINIDADAYLKKTSNLLLDAPVPATSGYTTVTRNIGNMENRGIELTLNTINIQKDNFSWYTNFNWSFLRNRITALGVSNADIIYGFKGVQILRVGQSAGSFYGYVRDGIWGTAQAAEAAKYGLKPGDVKIRDVNNDGVINPQDQAIIGKGIPDFYGTLANTVKYKQFDLVLEIQYSKGNQVFSNERNSGEGRFGTANNYSTVLDSWTPNNQNAILEQVRPTGYSYYMDSRKVSDGSFIRGKNLAIGYTLPALLSSKLGIRHLRVYTAVQNFFLLTKYYGYDPEVSNYDSNAFSQGVNYADYPKPRTLMFGASLTL
jgi:TonB-linked SusC/RagA family outer membrane protein